MSLVYVYLGYYFSPFLIRFASCSPREFFVRQAKGHQPISKLFISVHIRNALITLTASEKATPRRRLNNKKEEDGTIPTHNCNLSRNTKSNLDRLSRYQLMDFVVFKAKAVIFLPLMSNFLKETLVSWRLGLNKIYSWLKMYSNSANIFM